MENINTSKISAVRTKQCYLNDGRLDKIKKIAALCQEFLREYVLRLSGVDA